ncbi:glycerol-3-phosphate acyltransferase, partial [Thermodesulfobacteriota bacterium]
PTIETFKVSESKRSILEYYKNNCIAFFIPAAFTALSILEKETFQFVSSDLRGGYSFLQEFFKNEFALDIDKTPEYFIRKNIKIFIDDEIIIPHSTKPDAYNLTSAGLKKLKLFSGILKTYFESYWIVLNFFIRFPNKSISKKDRLKKIQARGNRMYKRDETELREALSKINYENAVDYFTSHNITSSDDEKEIEIYSRHIQNYLTLLK